ncbi:hypothetical protein [Paenibacillus hexagrammi]|uniref:Uncharacterized protein n=1 Tax=Paenibacillus hexagrammi TaxID=2908839 RepID=A0ABY3SNG2_9BACL|nr:hypothetical protein [Paenibacillus sp. YPD9-1]UJF34636.1 hypothetical protein L0M14_05520 [Paenibacillus sp. YPD9-1]
MYSFKLKKWVCLLTLADMLGGVLLTGTTAIASAAEVPVAGTPYQANGAYDVTEPHIVNNPMFGKGLAFASGTFVANSQLSSRIH